MRLRAGTSGFEFRNESAYDEVYGALRNGPYTDESLGTWKAAINAQPWNEAFVFFRHEDEGVPPLLASLLLALD